MHPNYVHTQHISDYHPHAADPTSDGTATVPDSASHGFIPPIKVSTDPVPPQAQAASPYMKSPASATLSHTPTGGLRSESSPLASRKEKKLAAGEPVTAEDVPWAPEVQRLYDEFIQEERRYVNEGRWDLFPAGSRLFVGNLSSESVTKRDIFAVFHVHGRLAQISIKQAYGFVQFLKADDCLHALQKEEGRQIRDKRIRMRFIDTRLSSHA